MPSAIPSGTRDPTPAEHHRALIVDSSPELNQLLTNLFDHADWSMQFAADNKDLLRGKDHVLKEYYKDETLKSELARKTFILPDRGFAPWQECGLRK